MRGSGIAEAPHPVEPAAGELRLAPVPVELPWSGFAEAADAVLALLQQRLGMDLWAVTRLREGTQQVQVGRCGALRIPPGTQLPWVESLCRQVLAGAAPRIVTDARVELSCGVVGIDRRFRVGAYVVLPLLTEDARLFGALCAFSGQRQPERLAEELPQVELMARMLATLQAKEEFAHERSVVAAAAYATAERDPLTTLLNRRGWQRVLEAEEQRCLRGGRCSAVAVVDLDGLADVNDTQGHEAGDELLARTAQVLRSAVRPCDQVARTGGDEFALIAADTGEEGVWAWADRLRALLHAAGVDVSVGAAASSATRPLQEAWYAADAAMLADQRARRGPRRCAG